jgi:hypothetical protein
MTNLGDVFFRRHGGEAVTEASRRAAQVLAVLHAVGQLLALSDAPDERAAPSAPATRAMVALCVVAGSYGLDPELAIERTRLRLAPPTLDDPLEQREALYEGVNAATGRLVRDVLAGKAARELIGGVGWLGILLVAWARLMGDADPIASCRGMAASDVFARLRALGVTAGD